MAALLGIEGIFLTPLIDVVVDILGPGIKSIAENKTSLNAWFKMKKNAQPNIGTKVLSY